jgi:hypothetical protein
VRNVDNVLVPIGSKLNTAIPTRDDHDDIVGIQSIEQIQQLVTSPSFTIVIAVGTLPNSHMQQHWY